MTKDKFSEWDKFYNTFQNFTDPDRAMEVYKRNRTRRGKKKVVQSAQKREAGGRWKNYNPRAALPSQNKDTKDRSEQKELRNGEDEQSGTAIRKTDIKDDI